MNGELRRELSSALGEEYIFDDAKNLEAYTHDSSPFGPVPPCVVVKPSNAEEVSAVLRIANRHHNQVVVRGAGTSMTGRTSSDPENSIILETTRLNRICEIDEQNMTIRAECGAIMGDLERELQKKRMYLHTVTVPLNYVTVGGVLSGVVGGGLPPRRPVYGTGVNFVLGLNVVLPDGRILSTGAGGANVRQKSDYIKGGNGPDLLGLFIGDAGIFGVKVEATLQIFPDPLLKQGDLRNFKNFSDSWNALTKLISLPTLPFSQLRIRDRETDYSLEYVVESSSEDTLQISLDSIAEICRKNGGSEGTDSDKEYAKNLPNIAQLRSEKFIRQPKMFVSFISGRKEFPTVYKEIKGFISAEIKTQQLDKNGVSMQIGFQPSLRNSIFCSINIEYDPDSEKSRSGVLSVGTRAYEKLVQMGCCPEPHQGFGAELMARYWSKEYKETMLGLKKLFDPNMVLNSSVWNLK